jgi:hypothetical protein
MSDVTVASPSAAPSSPAPSTPSPSEIPVDVNQSSSPQPVGAQAPDKPVDKQAQAQARRDSIQKAFDRATKQQEEGAQRQPRQKAQEEPKRSAAEAKAGHNQPPEETAKERYREGGKFARDPNRESQGANTAGQRNLSEVAAANGQGPGPEAQRNTPANPPGVGAQPQVPYRMLPEGTPFREPLKRMSEAAKHGWVDTPEPVRAAVHKMAQEFSKAYQAQKADVEAFKPIKRFHDFAKSQGTSLEAALTNFTNVEHLLRTDIVAGFAKIVDNLAQERGWKNSEGQPVNIRDVALHILSMSPEQHQLAQTRNAQTDTSQHLGAVYQKVEGLENAVNQMYAAQRYTQTRSVVDQFADQHPRIDELGGVIAQEISLGFPLEEAYRRADLLFPPTQAPQTRTTSAQTRSENRSINGAPDGGSTSADYRTEQRTRGQPRSRREAIQNAIRRVQGGI